MASPVGSWKLISFQTKVENEPPREEFGAHPNGYAIFTPGGRAMVVMSAQDRKGGMSDAEAAALLRSLIAYSAKYHCTDDELIAVLDVSWNESLNGSEQRRKFRMEGNRLFLESTPQPHWLEPSKNIHRSGCVGARGKILSSTRQFRAKSWELRPANSLAGSRRAEAPVLPPLSTMLLFPPPDMIRSFSGCVALAQLTASLWRRLRFAPR
jgi:lipocalin-like protein